jgi:23S rRNA (cytosine1962-C5)-methyltransferase
VDVYGAKLDGAGRKAKILGGQAVLQIYQEKLPAGMLDGLKALLRTDFGLEGFYEKGRFKKEDGKGEPAGTISGQSTPAQNERKSGAATETMEKQEADKSGAVEMIIHEYGHQFIVNLNQYLDTGIFLDHRETRRRVERQAAGLTVLNLFAYTGSFSVYAAAGGAAMTHTVDLSKTYCDWARRNLTLNGFPDDRHWIYRMDTFEFYKYAARKNLRFDLIIIDPPTFSRNKDSNFSVQRDQYKLIAGAAALLNPGGQILFSNNCLDFQMDRQMKEEFNIQNIQNETIPLDFWVDTINPNWWASPNQIHNCFLIRPK